MFDERCVRYYQCLWGCHPELGVTDKGEIFCVADHNKLKTLFLAIARSAEPPIKVEESRPWFQRVVS